ncbi:MAG: hypothetical protein WCF85_13710 [Rhodospirillaceae bacterium]
MSCRPMSGQYAPVLVVSVGERFFRIPSGLLCEVGEVGTVTPLPFTADWVEGLISAGDRPVLLVDPQRLLLIPTAPVDDRPLVSAATAAARLMARRQARVSGRPPSEGAFDVSTSKAIGINGCCGAAVVRGDRLLVLDLAGMPVALRVDRIISGSATEAFSSSPVLPFDTLAGVLGLVAPAAAGSPVYGRSAAGTPAGREVAVLIVAGSAGTQGILVEDGMSAGELDRCVNIVSGGALAVIDGLLFPVAGAAVAGGKAVIGHTPEGRAALPVDRLIGLETVAEAALVIVPGRAPGGNLGFSPADGAPVLLWDFETLARGSGPGEAYRRLVERTAAGGRAPAASPGTGGGLWEPAGLVVSVGGVRWLLPYALVDRMLDADERPLPGPPPGPRPSEGGRVPLVDARRWLRSGAAPPTDADGRAAVLLHFGVGGRLAMLVDAVALAAPGDEPWLPPPALPGALAALVAAVRREPETAGWCLCLRADLDLGTVPSSVRRSVAAAVTGRLTLRPAVRTNQ